MEISPIQLSFLFLYSCFFGGILGLLHDFNRLIRMMLGGSISPYGYKLWYETKLPLTGRPLRRSQARKGMKTFLSVCTFFQDLFLFLVAGAGTVILNYYFNDGRFRIYTVAGLAIGFAIYRLTLKKIILPMGECLFFCLWAMCCISFYVLSYPFVFFVIFLGRNAKKIERNIEKTIAIQQKKVYNKNKVKCILKNAEQGFMKDLSVMKKV